MKSKLIYGIGINDSAEPVSWYTLNGKREMCKIYSKWVCILQRCYSDYGLSENPTYRGVTICDDWKYFTKFKSWVQSQTWEDLDLDKDILIHGNKVYAPDLCVFVDQKVNNFLTERKMTSNPYPTGVVFLNHLNKFKAACHNVKTKQQKHIGLFETAEEAHLAWLFYKLEQAKSLASEQTDQRVAVALISRYENYLNKEKEVE